METQLVECLVCETVVEHTEGPVQPISDGAVDLVWWTCTVCGHHNLP